VTAIQKKGKKIVSAPHATSSAATHRHCATRGESFRAEADTVMARPDPFTISLARRPLHRSASARV
jgi:hypothetical protein